ncbi:sulfur carrier protein ThiS [Maridesulfovibrio ferrireducens]|uniref:sulfur carrier protein ThiS n=1 Tax=Maridesulfovibrio ferrireducens TaxID=246191 RepID=UPI001A35D8E8|nr:sulfur carrier protein ThiS [Maridesulfovibrio ferrireducens]MBI9111939.1 sulfur carrier protein ThiS [Maridesulfovibrio ferrireducens]
MIVILNGERTEINNNTSVLALLDSKQIAADTVVVELNKEIIPSDTFCNTMLNDGDHLEVLRFVGGG